MSKLTYSLLFLILPFLFAFRFSPMTQTIRLSDGQPKATFEIENNTSEAIPVVIKVVERIQMPDGGEKLPATSKLKAFPPQLVVPPNDKRSIRVNWLGGSDFKSEKSFRVVAEQVPLDVSVEDGKASAGIKMLLRYQAALYVDPGKTAAKVTLEKFQIEKESLKLYLENKGSAHQYLKEVAIRFKKGDREISLPKKALQKLEGQNVLAGSVRVFTVPAPKLVDQSYKGYIEFEQ